MTFNSDIESVSYGGPAGSVMPGMHRDIISGQGAAYALTRQQSGALVLLDLATQTITLPTPVKGIFYEFQTTVAATAQKVLTAVVASQFLNGAVTIGTIATASAGGFAANGTTIASIVQNGTTQGGLIGSKFKLTAISTTVWAIEGFLLGSGTVITGFATT